MEKSNRLTKEQLAAAFYYFFGWTQVKLMFKREFSDVELERAFFYLRFDIMFGILPHANVMSVGKCIGGSKDDWKCICGNEALSEGFFPCDMNGDEVEPTSKDWPVKWYVCTKCGRIIRQEDRRIVGVRVSPSTTCLSGEK